MRILGKGLLTGMTLQLALGPVFFYILNITLQRSVYDGFAGVTAVTLVDGLYIALAVLGLGKILEKPRVKRYFAILSPLVLMIFGGIIMKGALSGTAPLEESIREISLVQSFLSVFFLTLSSPLTIVFFTSLFASKALENNYNSKELALFGTGTGLATLLFMGSSVVLFSVVGARIPPQIVRILNGAVGLLLISYGIFRLVKGIRNLS